MNRVCCVLLLLAVGLCLTADLASAWAAEAAGASPQASLQGPWRAVSMVQNGERLSEANVRRLILVFSEKTIVMRVGETVAAETAYTLDTHSTPPAIDMTFKGQATLGIYERAGDNLRICLNDLGKGRPKRIPASPGADCDMDLLLYRADRDWHLLHVLDADGGNARLLVTHPEYTEHGSPEWSLDNSKIAFDACRMILGESWSTSHVLKCRADGQGLKDLGPGAMPSWAPDGKRITFSSYAPRGVWIMNADGTGRELLDPQGWGAEWCPKGNKIAYTRSTLGGANICVRDLAQNTSRDLLEERYRQVYWGMAWSPDGRWIAFKGVTPEKAELAVVSAEGQKEGFRVLVSGGTGEVRDIVDNVSWSPDGKQVLTALITQGNPLAQLHAVDLEGKAPPKPLPKQDKGRSQSSMAWSFDGKQILVTCTPKRR